MADEQREGKSGYFGPSIAVVTIAVLGLAAYQLYLGGSVQHLGFENLGIEFNPPTPKPNATTSSALPDASREFFIGRWFVRQKFGGTSGSSYMDWRADSTCDGEQDGFLNGKGIQIHQWCTNWNFEKLSDREFRLSANIITDLGQERFASVFRIIDATHIHNVDMNYEAVRQ